MLGNYQVATQVVASRVVLNSIVMDSMIDLQLNARCLVELAYRAIIHVTWLKIIDVSGAMSVPVIRSLKLR
jgi:hypothetical protein